MPQNACPQSGRRRGLALARSEVREDASRLFELFARPEWHPVRLVLARHELAQMLGEKVGADVAEPRLVRARVDPVVRRQDVAPDIFELAVLILGVLALLAFLLCFGDHA